MPAKKRKSGPTLQKQNMQAKVLATSKALLGIDMDRQPSDRDRKFAQRLLIKGQRCLENDEIQLAANYLVKAHKHEPTNRPVLLRLGNALRRLDQASEAITIFARLLKLGVPDPPMLFDVGNLAQSLDLLPAAENIFATYIQMRPGDHTGYMSLGGVKRLLGKYDEAIDLLTLAIKSNETEPILWESLADVVAEAKGVDAATAFFEEAIRLRPDFGAAYANIGLAYSAEGRFAAALPYLERSVQLLDDNANVHFSLATALTGIGDVKRGMEEYLWRLDRRRSDSVIFTHGLPRWQGEDISDKTILICDEQGIGDAMIFSQCFPDMIARAKHCIIECDHRLVSLFTRSFAEATIHRHVTFKVNAKLHRHYKYLEDLPEQPDIAIEAGTLPLFIRPDVDSFRGEPDYLKPDPERVAFWRQRFATIGAGLKVGICWSGGILTPIRKRRYLSLQQLAPLLEVDGVHFINVMYVNRKQEIAEAEQEYGVVIHDWDDIDRRNHIDEAFAYTAPLDLVISVSSSPSSIAGALGVPTIELQVARSRWMLGTDEKPGFKHTRVYLPTDFSDWPSGPIDRTREELRRRVRDAATA